MSAFTFDFAVQLLTLLIHAGFDEWIAITLGIDVRGEENVRPPSGDQSSPLASVAMCVN